jgi:hypothetical protein
MRRMSSGRYHWGGWTVDLSGEGVGRMASVHEAWHDRLQFTTIYGLLVQHLWPVGDATGELRWTSRGDKLLLGAQRTHEEFASVMTEQTSADLARALRASYPVYARHADRARQRVGSADEYTFLHRVNALYRACMQPEDAVAYAQDLAAVTAATVPRRARPDHRLAVLTAAIKRDGWNDTTKNPSPQRTIRDYADEDDAAWEQVSKAPTNGAPACCGNGSARRFRMRDNWSTSKRSTNTRVPSLAARSALCPPVHPRTAGKATPTS